MTTRFTGWCNIPLSDRGKEQAKAAARALVQFNLHTFDSVFMSVLERTTMTYDIIREEIFKMQKTNALGPAKHFKDPTIYQSWRLNERHYGALVGLSKEEAEHSMGREPVMGWRRSWDQRPPPMTRHPYFQALGSDTVPRFDWQTGTISTQSDRLSSTSLPLMYSLTFLLSLFLSPFLSLSLPLTFSLALIVSLPLFLTYFLSLPRSLTLYLSCHLNQIYGLKPSTLQ